MVGEVRSKKIQEKKYLLVQQDSEQNLNQDLHFQVENFFMVNVNVNFNELSKFS